ncbi:MAG: phage tail tape measure protein [Allorhizobium sp.]
MANLRSQLQLGLTDRITSPVRGISAALAGLQRQAAGFGVGGLIGRIAAFGAGYVGLTQGIGGTFDAARGLQAQLTEVGIKTGLSNDALAEMQRRLTALSGPTNQTTSALVEAIDIMTGMGLSADEAVGSIGAVGKAATATGATIADLSSATVSVMQNLKVPANEMTAALDAMASAGNNGAFELKAMAQYIPSLGAAYQAFGQQGVGAVADLASALQIVRTGTGDESTAANALANLLQKMNAPQTRAAFKKMGVDLGKQMEQATAKGMTPIESIAEITSDTLKGDLSKMGDLFADSEVQRALRPLLQNMAEYRRIRDEANRADGTVADSFNRRMQDANQKIRAFQVRMQNVGAAIGGNLLEPIGRLADHLSFVLDTADQRAGVFDKLGTAFKSFMAGLGVGDGGLKSITDLIFGVAGPDGVVAGEELGRIAYKFRTFGESARAASDAVANSKVGSFLTELGLVLGGLVMSKWFRLFAIAAGIAAIASAVQGASSLGDFVDNMSKLSTMEWLGIGAGLLFIGIKAAGAAKAIRDLASASRNMPKGATAPTTPSTPAAPGGNGLGGILRGITAGALALGVLSTLGGNGEVRQLTAEEQALMFNRGGEKPRGPDYGGLTRDPGAHGERLMGGVDLGTLRAAMAPQGVQAVNVTNPQPAPQVSVVNHFTISGAGDANAVANAVAAKIGDAAKSGVDSSLKGGPY